MTELSYTAWDDNRYQWPPPEGWYQASDGKWWPEGYGPPAATSDSAASVADSVAEDAVVESVVESTESVEAVAEAEIDQGAEVGEYAEVEGFAEVGEIVESAEIAEPAVNGSSTAESFVDAGQDVVDSEAAYSTSHFGSSSYGSAASTATSGLAGWAGDGATDIGSQVDVRHDYDYSAPEADTGDSPDDVEPGEELASIDSEIDRWSDSVVDGATDSAVDADEQAGEALDRLTDSVASEYETVDQPLHEGDALSRLDDLKRQVEEQDLGTEAAAATVGVEGLDPTRTLDIDPSELAPQTEHFYGDQGVAETGYDNGYGQTSGYESYVDAPSAQAAADTQVIEHGVPAYDAGPVDAAANYEAPGGHDSASVLTPVSTPPPRSGTGRRLLFVAIGFLAMLAAGVAGYLLFQYQNDDEPAANDVVDTGAEGSFSNPHSMDRGVRLTIPSADQGDRVWMLEVRQPASVTEAGDGQAEVMTRVRVRNDTPLIEGDAGLDLSGLRFVLVSADGSTVVEANDGCSAGDDLPDASPIPSGQNVEGNLCWTIAADQADGVLLGIESVDAPGRAHVRLS